MILFCLVLITAIMLIKGDNFDGSIEDYYEPLDNINYEDDIWL